jgi:hypothetical protein
MRLVILAASAISLASVAAQAQTVSTQPATAAKPDFSTPAPSIKPGEKPIDNGPTTPDSNAAYRGGGVVLQGAPGAPAPAPQPTPPGQPPQNAIPK